MDESSPSSLRIETSRTRDDHETIPSPNVSPPTPTPRKKTRCVSCLDNVLPSNKVVVDGVIYHMECWRKIESGDTKEDDPQDDIICQNESPLVGHVDNDGEDIVKDEDYQENKEGRDDDFHQKEPETNIETETRMDDVDDGNKSHLSQAFREDEKSHVDVHDVHHYPTTLNPFGEDLDVTYPTELNPFGDDGDKSRYDDSLNPFATSSEDEDEEDDDIDLTTCTPIPKPRNSLNNVSLRSSRSTISAPESSINSASGGCPSSFRRTVFMTNSFNRKSLTRPSDPPPPLPVDINGRPLTPNSYKKSRAPVPPTQGHSSILSVSSTSTPTTPESTRSNPVIRKKRPAPEPPKAVRRTVVGSIDEIEQELNQLGDRLAAIQIRLVHIEELFKNNAPESPRDSPEETEESLLYEYLSLCKENCVIGRRQEELMYQRREHKLEEEHADIEYNIRALELIPPFKRTPQDETMIQDLIVRMIDIIDQRNDVVENMTKINKRPDFDKMVDRLRRLKDDEQHFESVLWKFLQENDLEVVQTKMMSIDIGDHDKKSKKTKKKNKLSRKKSMSTDDIRKGQHKSKNPLKTLKKFGTLSRNISKNV